MTDGEDVRQLERNLSALGYDPGTVDDDWDWETTAAVDATSRTPAASTEDGTLAAGEVVFRAGRDPHRRGEGERGPDESAPARRSRASSSTAAA